MILAHSVEGIFTDAAIELLLLASPVVLTAAATVQVVSIITARRMPPALPVTFAAIGLVWAAALTALHFADVYDQFDILDYYLLLGPGSACLILAGLAGYFVRRRRLSVRGAPPPPAGEQASPE